MSLRPNIVHLHTHDCGRFFSPYGHRIRTPHLERLASEGVRFDSYFCAAPQCSPSRAAAMTGLYPHQNGMMGLAHLGWGLREGIVPLPRLLGERAGYRTRLFGVQHEARSGDELGYQRTEATTMPQRADEVTDAFAAFLDNEGVGDDHAPFFASVGFWEGHRPFDDPAYEPAPEREIEVPPFLPDVPAVRTELAQLHGLIHAVDRNVGRILDALDASGLSDSTLLLVSTDHGVAMPGAKGTLHDPGIGIALLARWPGRVPAGETRDALLSNVDLTPTLLDLAGAEPPYALTGRSFLPLLLGERTRSGTRSSPT